MSNSTQHVHVSLHLNDLKKNRFVYLITCCHPTDPSGFLSTSSQSSIIYVVSRFKVLSCPHKQLEKEAHTTGQQKLTDTLADLEHEVEEACSS